MMASNSGEPKVLIIGAGIVGLLVAQGLKKHSISFQIFEAEPSATHYRDREWGMSVQWGLPMLSSVLPPELLDRLQSVAVDPHYFYPDGGNYMPTYDAQTGELIKQIPLVKMLRVSRRKMRALCAEGIHVQYSKTLRALTDNGKTITAQFEDASIVEGTLVLGADGANSAVRLAAFSGNGTGKAYSVPYGGANLHVNYHDADIARATRKALTPIQAIGVHPRGYWLWLSVQDVPHPEQPEDWTFQLQWTWKLGPDTQRLAELDLAKLKAEASEVFGEPFKTAWVSIPDGTRVPNNRISVWEPVPLPNAAWGGKVALVGDAAHAMSFHRGQGMNHGIADAVKLTQLLADAASGKITPAEAIADYEVEMNKRAGEEVAISKMNTEMMHDWERLLNSPFMQRGGDKNK